MRANSNEDQINICAANNTKIKASLLNLQESFISLTKFPKFDLSRKAQK